MLHEQLAQVGLGIWDDLKAAHAIVYGRGCGRHWNECIAWEILSEETRQGKMSVENTLKFLLLINSPNIARNIFVNDCGIDSDIYFLSFLETF